MGAFLLGSFISLGFNVPILDIDYVAAIITMMYNAYILFSIKRDPLGYLWPSQPFNKIFIAGNFFVFIIAFLVIII